MRSSQSLLAICSLLSLSGGSAASADSDAVIQNANHIFNVIQDSMRQWGSSLHHNGVSFFLAHIPAGTQLYHGTSKSTPVNGTEWLAFEPEHAMVFARPHRGGPPRRPEGPDEEEDIDDGHHEELRRRQHHGPGDKPPGPPPHLPPGPPPDMPPGPPPPFEVFEASEEEQGGYLHTYATAKDLRLVYIDGMSAAKTNKGTLDSQDVLLFNNTLDDTPREGQRGPMGEFERATKACEMSENEWGGRIDGVLRMEAGFEVILCAFERDLTPVRIIQVKSDSREGGRTGRMHDGHAGPRKDDDGKRRGPPGGPGGPGGGMDSARWMRAVTARYGGIGGDRVSLNYDHFVTAFAYDLDLFQDNSSLPRLGQVPDDDLDVVRRDLNALILAHDASETSRNWQAITDMIVKRYSDELSYLASGDFNDIKSLHQHIETILAPFIDYSERDTASEAERCATQFLPLATQDSHVVAARAVHSVTHRVCSTLLGAWTEEDLGSAVQKVQALIDYLDWASWKKCRGCADHEICVVPIWPMGSVADYEKPTCREASSPYDGNGESYWGGRHH